jgi:hypothetical protein
MNQTALRLENTLRAIGETWALYQIKHLGASAVSDKANVEGYAPMIENSARAMKAIDTLIRSNPDLRKSDALFIASNGAASAVGRAAGHLSA